GAHQRVVPDGRAVPARLVLAAARPSRPDVSLQGTRGATSGRPRSTPQQRDSSVSRRLQSRAATTSTEIGLESHPQGYARTPISGPRTDQPGATTKPAASGRRPREGSGVRASHSAKNGSVSAMKRGPNPHPPHHVETKP